MEDAYKLAKKRATDELENDETAAPNTKRVLLYGWDGLSKVRILTDSGGSLIPRSLTSPLEAIVATATSAASAVSGSSSQTWLSIQNAGSKMVYFGSSAVTTADGTKMTPMMSWIFQNNDSDFKVYLVAAVGESSEVRVSER